MIATLARLLARPLQSRRRVVVNDVASPGFEPRDAIVVLGARLGAGDHLTPVLVERVVTAVEIFRRGAAPIVVTTGGLTGGTRAEAVVLADALVAGGIPREHILVEDRAHTTADNARFTRQLVTESVWLVTQPFHARRAERLFRDAGFRADVWPIEHSIESDDPRRALRWYVREYAAWLKYLLTRRRF